MGTATIAGTEYQTAIMPDGREWTLANLDVDAYGGIFYRNNGILYPGDVFGRLYPYDRHGEIADALIDGWRIPNNSDWLGLISSAGIGDTANTQYAGSSLRVIGAFLFGYVVWDFAGGTDDYDFAAVGTGKLDSGSVFKDHRSAAHFASSSPPYITEPAYPRPYSTFVVTGGTGAPGSSKCELQSPPTDALSGSTATCCVSVRLVRDAPQMNLHVVHDGTWKQVSEQHQIDGGWVKSSKIFVPSSGAWAQS